MVLVTELVGAVRLTEVAGFDLRIVRRDDGRWCGLLGGSLDATPHESLDAARTVTEREWRRRGATVTWRSLHTPSAGELACFACGAVVAPTAESPARHPEKLCPACVLEAVDEDGRALAFANADASGGFIARYASGEPRAGHECFVRGRKCWADEARFGGIVVVPFERR